MRHLPPFTLFVLLSCLPLSAQVKVASDKSLEKDIIQTGLIHSPLPVDDTYAYESNGLKKKILHYAPLELTQELPGWTAGGYGQLTYSRQKMLSGKGNLRLAHPTSTGKRAKGSPSDPDYATYGDCRLTYQAEGADWRKFNRIAFSIYPDCDGARVVTLNFSFENADSPYQPGTNRKSGSHLILLNNRQWNHCFLDLDEYQRDRVNRIGFYVSLKGKDRTTGDSAVYYIDQIQLQQVDAPEIVSGWDPAPGKIIYSTTGYVREEAKTAITTVSANQHKGVFHLLRAEDGKSVFKGKVERQKTSVGEFDILDFSSFKQPGNYKLSVGNSETIPFVIDDHIWDNSLWRVLNFVFCQRCGYPVPGKHGTCHTDLCSEHNGQKISYAGGWHDAGDLSQQTLQTGDVAFALLETYNKLKDEHPLLAARVLEEAEWGIEFVLKTRFGDGYRASSVGLLIWQDGIFNTFDDINTVRKQNLAFNNFLYAGYEAYAAMSIDRDPMLQEHLQRVAKEDFEFAMQRHREIGYGEFLHMYEHGYNTSESQYMATLSWAASMLYKLTGDKSYARLAAEHIQYTLNCQRKEPVGKERIRGFFYRDQSRQSIVHYIHQSREQVYMQALVALCETQPGHAEYAQWEEGIRLYGEYLKKLMTYTAPYGMVPSGVYHKDEPRDSTGFYRLHLFPPHNAKELYDEQIKKGIQLDEEHYIKRFPVWFSIFNGNNAILLSTGKAAVICGKFLKDKELIRIGREQMYWTVGKNPFGQSMIYGEGANFPQMDNFSSGQAVGSMPVGIRSLNNEDIPYWPQTNNACYKEVWVTSAGKWFSLFAEF